jgi:hypothetical protein
MWEDGGVKRRGWVGDIDRVSTETFQTYEVENPYTVRCCHDVKLVLKGVM